MKRSQKEYEEILNFIKSELTSSSNHWNKPPTKELEIRFNNWATNNNIRPVGLRTIQNYISVLKDDKDHKLSNPNDRLSPVGQDKNKSHSTKSLEPGINLEVEQMELAQKILEHWLYILPESIKKELPSPIEQGSSIQPQALTIAHPHNKLKDGINDLVLKFLSLIKRGKICRFTYKPGHSHMDDNMELTPDGFSWLKVVYSLPLQLNIYMDRVYLLSLSLSKKDLLERTYLNSKFKFTQISRHVLANIYEYKVDALEDYVKDTEELFPLSEPIVEFQDLYKPALIMEMFSIPQIQEHMIGVVLPTEQQISENSTDDQEFRESPFKPYRPPKPISLIFSDWAMRYILNSPLHPTQILKETRVVVQASEQMENQNDPPSARSIERGLFEFTVWNTEDFAFRVASFREFCWPAELGFEKENSVNGLDEA
ncbi:MAG: hypothetical protein ACKO55_12395 [Bacteroidota bacterium]